MIKFSTSYHIYPDAMRAVLHVDPVVAVVPQSLDSQVLPCTDTVPCSCFNEEVLWYL